MKNLLKTIAIALAFSIVFCMSGFTKAGKAAQRASTSSKTGTVTATLEILYNSASHSVTSGKYYVTAYSDSMCTIPVVTKSVILRNQSSNAVSFQGLEPGSYYFALSRANGKLRVDEKNLTISYPTGNVVTVSYGGATQILRVQLNYADEDGQKTTIAHYHTYKSYITKATPASYGVIITKCLSCGDSNYYQTIYRPSKVKLSKSSYVYDGKVKKPVVSVVDDNGELLDETNYSVVYPKERVKVGTYTVKVNLKGSFYSGTMKKTFKINPAGVSLSSVSSTASGKMKVKWKRNSTATGYELQYSATSKFTKPTTIKITKNSTVSKSISKLVKGKKYYVRVRTYQTVSNKNYYSAWSKSKSIIIKK